MTDLISPTSEPPDKQAQTTHVSAPRIPTDTSLQSNQIHEVSDASGSCLLCNEADGYVLHVLRDCRVSSAAWQQLILASHSQFFFTLTCRIGLLDIYAHRQHTQNRISLGYPYFFRLFGNYGKVEMMLSSTMLCIPKRLLLTAPSDGLDITQEVVRNALA
ncbi:hypothetical protein V6N11_001184 [Hibiscus sabdariffa]|uniref:Reverse transcriptase zinc-binding domain-containing protein n=1 Tax=Hibiscus sabdariffa TaxID=183260 RepID=A0ABR2RZ00_9ROSI